MRISLVGANSVTGRDLAFMMSLSVGPIHIQAALKVNDQQMKTLKRKASIELLGFPQQAVGY